jgi:cyclopropane fatty-acyl-phospholipid synthase-like methyltransferase
MSDGPASRSVDFFKSVYDGLPAWEIGVPQPAVVRLEETGQIVGSVLDIGCGTGANAIYLAERGHEVLAFELAPRAIELANQRLGNRSLPVEFRVADVLRLGDLGRQFETALDAGVFHVFSDKDRPRYAQNVHRHLKPGGYLYLLCFSEHQPGTEGPRRVTQQEIRDTFTSGWHVESIAPSSYQTRPETMGEAKAWLATIRKTKEPRTK